MRKRLLSAVLTCYASRKQHEAPSIEDVIREAAVSRPTFYLHFVSLEGAVNALGNEIADETVKNMKAFFQSKASPLQRLATSIQLFLVRSVTDPIWAAFGARTDFLSQNTSLLKAQEDDLLEAKKAGMINFEHVDAAANLMNGAMMEGMRHLVKTDDRNRAYIEETTVMILCGLRADYELAKHVVHDRAIYIRGLAPDCLPWWRDPWA